MPSRPFLWAVHPDSLKMDTSGSCMLFNSTIDNRRYRCFFLIFKIYLKYPLTRNHLVAYNAYMNKNNEDAIFKALDDPTRRLILDELSERNELTLYELTARLIMKHNLSISRQAIAKHLSVLENAGLAASKRKGKYRVITFNNQPLKNLLKGWVE